MGRLTLGITPSGPSRHAVTGGSGISEQKLQKHDVSKLKARYAPEDLGKRARKDGVAKRRPQDEDKKHSEGETQKPDGFSRRARVAWGESVQRVEMG